MKRIIEELTKNMDKEIDYYKTLATAWSKVTRQKTKDGKDFKVFSKNFGGDHVRITKNDFSLRDEKKIEVWASSEKNGIIEDHMNTTRAATNETPEERKIKVSMLTAYYILTPDELWQEIQNNVKYYNERAKELEKQREKIETAVENYKENYKNALLQLANDCGGRNTLYNKIERAIDEYKALNY